MSTPFDPELRNAARFLPRRPVRPRTVPLIRVLLGRLAGRPTKGVEVVQLGAISVRLHRPVGVAGPRPAVLWIHGGGFVIGVAAQDDAACARWAREQGAVVAAVDYRLAPEHPFPIPLDDCHDALVWLAGRDDVDADRVAIAGGSAGGGLAAGLALLARDRAEVRPVAQVLAYPMLDDRTVLRHNIDRRPLRLWDDTSNRFGWSAYLGGTPGGVEVPAYAAPARAEDLTGLPAAWIGVGTCDLFHSEDVAYADRLEAAGVPVHLHSVEGAFHAFDDVRPKASVSKAFAASIDAFLTAAFRAPTSEMHGEE